MISARNAPRNTSSKIAPDRGAEIKSVWRERNQRENRLDSKGGLPLLWLVVGGAWLWWFAPRRHASDSSRRREQSRQPVGPGRTSAGSGREHTSRGTNRRASRPVH